jgi:hypothetical protein
MENIKEKKFNGWMWVLKLVAVSHFKFKETTVFSREHWRIYFDEGFNAIEALQEDFTYL